jgi:DNA-binding CsgD family transcriptional regulator
MRRQREPQEGAAMLTSKLRAVQELETGMKPMDLNVLQKLGISPREAEVLIWISQGKKNSEIAAILNVAERTVLKHCEHLFSKLGVETRTCAMAMAFNAMRQPEGRVCKGADKID